MEPQNANGSDRDSAADPSTLLGYPSEVLAEMLLRRSLGPSLVRKATAGRPCTLLLVVEDPELLKPLTRAMEGLAHDDARVVMSDAPKKSGSTGDLSALVGVSGGIPAVHLCTDTRYVPPAFMAVAQVIKVPRVDGKLVRKAMGRCCKGRVPASVGDLDLSRVGFKVLCACIARGASATKSTRVLAMVASQVPPAEDDWLPDLSECAEYGSARDWGIRVMRDMAEWSAGRMRAEDLDSAALLVSDPGQGKGFFARVLAKSLGIPLIRFGVGDLFRNDGYLSSTLAQLRLAFVEARATAPAILFLDEIDSFSKRGSEDRNDAYFSALVNELLTLLDAADLNAGVIIIAATNREDEVDPALLRPGRLSTTIRLEMPDQEGLEHIYRVQLRTDLPGHDLLRIAALSVGSTPAAIMHWVRLARSEAKAQSRQLSLQDLERQVLGTLKASARDLRKIAVHEAGHAVVACVLGRHGSGVHHVSLVPSDGNLGRALIREGEDRVLGRRQLEERVLVLLAGRAAEELEFADEPSVGAGGPVGSDLWAATRIVASIQGSFGLAGSLLWRGAPGDMEALLGRDPTFRASVDARLVDLYVRAKGLLAGRRHALDAVVEALLDRHVLSGKEISDLIGPVERRMPAAPSIAGKVVPTTREAVFPP